MAKQLGLTDPAAAILEEGANPASHFYPHLLDQCEKLFDGEIDTPTFEETVRYMYGIRAYPAFTLDKVVAGVIKHCQNILTDGKSQELYALLQADRKYEGGRSTRQQIAYRVEAEKTLAPEENVFKIEWVGSARKRATGRGDSWFDFAGTLFSSARPSDYGLSCSPRRTSLPTIYRLPSNSGRLI